MLLALAPAATAEAATYCVGVRAAGCTAKDTAADAFASARADTERDTILLGRISEAGPFADATGRPVRVVGLGAEATRLRAGATGATLRLLDPGSSARAVRVDGGAAAPALQIDDGASMESSVVLGRVRVRGGAAGLSSVLVDAASPAVELTCDTGSARLALGHVTVRGSGDAGVAGACATPGRTLAVTATDSIVWGFARGFDLGGAPLSATYSDFPEATGDTNLAADPRFTAPGDARPQPGSPVLDAGRPGELADTETHEDALGFVRIADGTGDGTLRRDMGALELQPPALGQVTGNVALQRRRGGRHARRGRHLQPRAAAVVAQRRLHVRPLRHRRGQLPVPVAADRRGARRRRRVLHRRPGQGQHRHAGRRRARGRAGDRPRRGLRRPVGAARRLPRQPGRRDRRGRVPRPRRPRARAPADRPGHGRRPRRRDEPAPAGDVGRDAAADPLRRRHAALRPGRRRLRRRLLRLGRARPAGVGGRPARGPVAARGPPAAPVRRRGGRLAPRRRRPPPPHLGPARLREPRRAPLHGERGRDRAGHAHGRAPRGAAGVLAAPGAHDARLDPALAARAGARSPRRGACAGTSTSPRATARGSPARRPRRPGSCAGAGSAASAAARSAPAPARRARPAGASPRGRGPGSARTSGARPPRRGGPRSAGRDPRS